MSKLLTTSFSGGLVPEAVTIISGATAHGLGRHHRYSWGLGRLDSHGAGQADMQVTVPNSTTGVRGSFYTRAVDTYDYTGGMTLVQVGDVALNLKDLDTLEVVINGVAEATTATLTNSIFPGFTNEVSFSVDLSATVGAVTFIVNGDTLSLTNLNTVGTSVNSINIKGMKGTRSGSAIMDIAIYDDQGASFNGIPPFIHCNRAGNRHIESTKNNAFNASWEISGTIPTTPKNSLTISPTSTDQAMAMGWSPLQETVYFASDQYWITYDGTTLSNSNTETVPSLVSPAVSDAGTYVAFSDRIYFVGDDGGDKLMYLDCATGAVTSTGLTISSNFRSIIYVQKTEQLFIIYRSATVKIYDLPTEAEVTSLTVPAAVHFGDYCFKEEELYLMASNNLYVYDINGLTQVTSSPFAVSSYVATAKAANLVYNPTQNWVHWQSSDTKGTHTMDCATKTITLHHTDTYGFGWSAFDPNITGCYRKRFNVNQFTALDNLSGSKTIALCVFTDMHNDVRPIFIESRKSLFYVNSARSALIESSVPEDNANTKAHMVRRSDDTGKIKSNLAGDKYSNTLVADSVSTAGSPEYIGVNIKYENVSGENSSVQMGLEDSTTNQDLGSSVATTGTDQDVVRTAFLNGSSNDFSQADFDALEPSIEAL